ncbi:MAG: hypothetical protein E7655_01390 [Ruminococcaceae bacterium]|nr:hypothetical protein [Oscillospiraceae bacterium]
MKNTRICILFALFVILLPLIVGCQAQEEEQAKVIMEFCYQGSYYTSKKISCVLFDNEKLLIRSVDNYEMMEMLADNRKLDPKRALESLDRSRMSVLYQLDQEDYETIVNAIAQMENEADVFAYRENYLNGSDILVRTEGGVYRYANGTGVCEVLTAQNINADNETIEQSLLTIDELLVPLMTECYEKLLIYYHFRIY